MSIEWIDDLRADGRQHLLAQYQDLPVLEALLGAFVSQLQDIEDALCELSGALDIGLMSGERLNVLGRILETSRDGLSDEEYRRRLSVRIRASRSLGLAEDLIEVAQLWGVSYVQISEGEGATVAVDVGAVDDPDRLVAWLSLATAAGVELHGLSYATWDDADTLCFSDSWGGIEASDASQGLGSSYDDLYGGRVVGILGGDALPVDDVRQFSAAFGSSHQ